MMTSQTCLAEVCQLLATFSMNQLFFFLRHICTFFFFVSMNWKPHLLKLICSSSSIWDKIRLEANKGKVWSRSKDGIATCSSFNVISLSVSVLLNLTINLKQQPTFPLNLNYKLVSVGLNELYYSYMQALIWSKMSTGLPIEISSSMRNQNYISFCRLDIDIHKYDFNCCKL